MNTTMNTTMNTQTIPAALLHALDYLEARPYRSNYNHAAAMAADCLSGRSHYLDADTSLQCLSAWSGLVRKTQSL